MSKYHISVLLQEAVEALQIQPGHKYIDATLGGGGHSFEIVKKGGCVLGIDQDEDAISEVEKRKKEGSFADTQLKIIKGNFANISEIAHANGFEKVDGILLDLGISSHHIDVGERGFSFVMQGPLDMRMDKNLSVTAADLVNGLTRYELEELFTRYGEESFAKRIAQEISQTRIHESITTTTQLADIVSRVVKKTGKTHPATKVFQALRIAVNDELNNLKSVLPQAVDLLLSKGRLVVISFHSLEDRIVKNAFENFEQTGLGTIISKKPIEPTVSEQENNRRSRSAKMRIFERI